MDSHRFALDLITLYHPDFWGVSDRSALLELESRAVWDRMLATAHGAGVTGIEVTFPPGDLDTARESYGGAAGLRTALDEHDLQVIGGYFAGLDVVTAPLDPGQQRRAVADAARYAASIVDAGGDIVIGGMPSLDRSVDRGPSGYVDFDYVKALADLVNRVGATIAAEGAQYAMHPEYGSVFCRRRDIDLFMLLTDPDLVGFCPDTAHITLAGGDPVAIAEAHRERLTLTHWKDAAGPFRGALPEGEARHAAIGPLFSEVGEGAVDWQAWQRMLDRVGYTGWTVLEIDSCPDPEEQVRRAKAFVESALV